VSVKQFALLLWGTYAVVVSLFLAFIAAANNQLPGLEHNTPGMVGVWTNFYGSLLASLAVSIPLTGAVPLIALWWRKEGERMRLGPAATQEATVLRGRLKAILSEPPMRKPSTPRGIVPTKVHRTVALLRPVPLGSWVPLLKSYDSMNREMIAAAQAFLDAYDVWNNETLKLSYDAAKWIRTCDRKQLRMEGYAVADAAAYCLGVLAGVEQEELLESGRLPADAAVLDRYVSLVRDEESMRPRRDAYIAALHRLRDATRKLEGTCFVPYTGAGW